MSDYTKIGEGLSKKNHKYLKYRGSAFGYFIAALGIMGGLLIPFVNLGVIYYLAGRKLPWLDKYAGRFSLRNYPIFSSVAAVLMLLYSASWVLAITLDLSKTAWTSFLLFNLSIPVHTITVAIACIALGSFLGVITFAAFSKGTQRMNRKIAQDYEKLAIKFGITLDFDLVQLLQTLKNLNQSFTKAYQKKLHACFVEACKRQVGEDALREIYDKLNLELDGSVKSTLDNLLLIYDYCSAYSKWMQRSKEVSHLFNIEKDQLQKALPSTLEFFIKFMLKVYDYDKTFLNNSNNIEDNKRTLWGHEEYQHEFVDWFKNYQEKNTDPYNTSDIDNLFKAIQNYKQIQSKLIEDNQLIACIQTCQGLLHKKTDNYTEFYVKMFLEAMKLAKNRLDKDPAFNQLLWESHILEVLGDLQQDDNQSNNEVMALWSNVQSSHAELWAQSNKIHVDTCVKGFKLTDNITSFTQQNWQEIHEIANSNQKKQVSQIKQVIQDCLNIQDGTITQDRIIAILKAGTIDKIPGYQTYVLNPVLKKATELLKKGEVMADFNKQVRAALGLDDREKRLALCNTDTSTKMYELTHTLKKQSDRLYVLSECNSIQRTLECNTSNLDKMQGKALAKRLEYMQDLTTDKNQHKIISQLQTEVSNQSAGSITSYELLKGSQVQEIIGQNTQSPRSNKKSAVKKRKGTGGDLLKNATTENNEAKKKETGLFSRILSRSG